LHELWEHGGLLGTVTLRNKREVYDCAEGSDWYVIVEHSSARPYPHRVLRKNVSAMHEALKGRTVTVNDVLDDFERGRIPGLRLNSYREWKRGFEVQNVLIVLCVLGLASLDKKGRAFIYTVKPESTLPGDRSA